MDCSYIDFSVYGTCKRKFLLERLEMEKHNLLCYSLNLLMTTPKKGYDALWVSTKENIRLVEQMLNELPNEVGVSIYIETFMDFLPCNEVDAYMGRFEVISSEPQTESYYFKVPKRLYDIWGSNFKEAEERRKQDKPCFLGIKVKKGEVVEIDWIDNWT